MKILANSPVQYHASLFRELTNLGIEVDVGYYHPGATRADSYDNGFGLSFAWDIDLLSGYSYRMFNKGRISFSAIEQVRILLKIIKWILAKPRTPLLLFGWSPQIFLLVWLFCLTVGIDIIIIGDNIIRPKTLYKSWRGSVLRWLLRRTSAVLYVGTRNRDYWLDQGLVPEKLFYTPHSVDNHFILKGYEGLKGQRRDLCKRFGIDPNLPTFVFCGKFIPIKRPVQLLDAYLNAGLQNSAQLIYVGDGALRSALEDRIRLNGLKYVHLLGFFNQSQMPIAYILGEILCLISESETWGFVVNEALVCSRPVIITDTVGCAPDLVTSENGWVVPDDQVTHALPSILLKAYEDRDGWPLMGQKGFSKIQKNSYSAMASGIKEALEYISHGK